MKNKFKSFASLLIALIIFLNANAQKLNSSKTKVKPTNQLGSILPFFPLELTDTGKTRLEMDQLDPNKTVVIMMFNPTCEHCIIQAKDIIKNQKEYGDAIFIMATGDQMGPYMQTFYDSVGYKFQSNIAIGLDIAMGTIDLFAYDGLPQIMVYGKDRKLIDLFSKEQSPELIKAAIKRDNSLPLTKKELELYMNNRGSIVMGTPLEENRSVPLPANHPFITKKYFAVPSVFKPEIKVATKVEIIPEVVDKATKKATKNSRKKSRRNK
jgi:thiol-disulfide isomerase/thioredoxin